MINMTLFDGLLISENGPHNNIISLRYFHASKARLPPEFS
jgi:hypothetical protein